MDQRSGRRYALAGLSSMGAGALILVGVLPGNVGAAVQQESTPSTSVVTGNATCSDLAPEGTTWTELKVEPVVDGTFTDGVLTVTIDVRDTADGPVFDWTSDIGVDAVFVKGGPVGGTLYLYDPPAESMGDTGLHTPVNSMNGKFSGLSHISFCYDTEQGRTSTTAEETTSTTVGESTTTVGAVTPTTTPGGGLPRTGSTVGPMLGIGAALLLGGGLLVAYARRFRSL
jgi:LPXTG-motif cell wall-anchored protein